jgi:hypothetical protein
VAVVPRPLADTSIRRRGAALKAWAVLALALLMGPAAAAVDVDLKRYAEAERAGAAAGVSGRAYTERRKPDASDKPLAGATVVALPRSEALVRRLQQLRDGARDSAPAYRQAATLIQKAREAYERELWEAGAAELVRTAIVDADGRFDLGRLPEGRWIVLGTWDQFVDARASKPGRKDRETYLWVPRLVGFRSRLVWLQDVEVSRAEGGVELQLTDRNVWFTGVVEERILDAGPSR